MKKTIIGVVALLVIVLGVYFLFGEKKQDAPLVVSPTQNNQQASIQYQSQNISFNQIDSDWNHVYNKTYPPFVGGTVLDLNNDGVDELFITGGDGQKDAYLVYENGLMVDRIDQLGISSTDPSYGALSIDLDGDEDTDLVVARESGLYMYYNQNGTLVADAPVALPKDTIVVDVAPGDIDNDGDADLYLSTFIVASKLVSATFNKEGHGKPNIMLRNDGDGVFTDVTSQWGLDYDTNTFTASFVELDGDEHVDLVLSPNTNKIQLYKNTGSSFEAQPPIGEFGFWMGLGISDIDLDGDSDLFFSNSGSSIANRLARGDLRSDQVLSTDYTLLRNEGGFNFTDITEQTPEQPFGWGIVALDVNSDNQDEWIVSQNYVKWPPHKLKKNPGSVLQRSSEGYVDVVNGSGLENKYFGFSTLVGDVDGDRQLDVTYLNVGQEVRILLSDSEQTNNLLHVLLPDTVVTQQSLYTLTVGESVISKRYSPKQGIMTDQAARLQFSLGDQEVGVMTVTTPDGETQEYEVSVGVLDLRESGSSL